MRGEDFNRMLKFFICKMVAYLNVGYILCDLDNCEKYRTRNRVPNKSKSDTANGLGYYKINDRTTEYI